jgi:hypothetical protein
MVVVHRGPHCPFCKKYLTQLEALLSKFHGLGLYISDSRSAAETHRLFPESALFIVNDMGEVQIAFVSNAPFVRPDLAVIESGLAFICSKDCPIRSTYTGWGGDAGRQTRLSRATASC